MNAIPYLLYEDAPAAIEFLTRAFGFREINRTTGADGVVLNCELIGPAGGIVWLGQSPPSGTSLVYLYVNDADAHRARAKAEGATIVDEPEDQPFGDRRYSAKDPQGHLWFFAHPISDESPARRA
ncbi:MAG: VOC family protein [Actinomycetota bacterium]